MHNEIDWMLLKEIRERFISGGHLTIEDYWKNIHVLKQYDASFAQRIGWKWDAVLNKSIPSIDRLRPLKPAIIDWGSGTGIAARAFTHKWGKQFLSKVCFLDRSKLAVMFSQDRFKAEFPSLSNSIVNEEPTKDNEPTIVLISHVLSELKSHLPKELVTLITKASAIVWIEPGTFELSHRLISIREKLKNKFAWTAPCPHQNTCGIFQTRSSDWCHHFAKPPASIFQDRFWIKFGTEMGIDLRSLPVSYLVGINHKMTSSQSGDIGNPTPQALIVGRVRSYKGYVKALVCEKAGVSEKKLLDRVNPELAKNLRHSPFSLTISDKSL